MGDRRALEPEGALPIWSFVFGTLGALLAIPLSLLVKALLVDATRPATGCGSARDTSTDDASVAVEDDPDSSPPVRPTGR